VCSSTEIIIIIIIIIPSTEEPQKTVILGTAPSITSLTANVFSRNCYVMSLRDFVRRWLMDKFPVRWCENNM
jgi:hypothetical protein